MRSKRIHILLVATLTVFFLLPISSSADDSCRHYNYSYVYEDIPGTGNHYKIKKCDSCGEEISRSEEDHFTVTPSSYKRYDQNGHLAFYDCLHCNAITQSYEKHNLSLDCTYENVPKANCHYRVYTCTRCGEKVKEPDEHSLLYEPDSYTSINQYGHYANYRCYSCNGIMQQYEKHYNDEKTIRLATPKKKGVVRIKCSKCSYSKNKSVKWAYGKDHCLTYDIYDYSLVFFNSNTITVKLTRALKGAVLKVKIGKKTYKKKLNNTKKKVKVKIGNNPIGSKISVKLYYKNRLIGMDESDNYEYGWDRVLYARKIHLGMTTEQVKYTETWGAPDRTGSASGGWTFWYYNSGAYVAFQNGVVKQWVA